jgi:serine palmitoyltransferase
MESVSMEEALSPLSPLSRFGLLVSFLSDNLEPLHWVIESVLILFILFLFFQKSYKPKERKLTAKEVEELIDDFEPEPLVPGMTKKQEMDMASTVLLEDGSVFPRARVRGKEVLNLAAASYLGYLQREELVSGAVSAISRYGTGSCGPRGFLGTVDVHLDLEKKLRDFLSAEDCIIYSSQYATVISFISCMVGRHDVLVVDRGAKHAIKLGADLSRARVEWYEHNDMQDLHRVWEKLLPLRQSGKIPFTSRIWLVAEALSENFGDICPLPDILKMKEKYCFRVVLEESNSIGVLGKTGRGLTEHFGVPLSSVECVVGSMAATLSRYTP